MVDQKKVKELKDGIDDLVSMKKDLDERWEAYEKRLEKNGDTGNMYTENIKASKEVNRYKEELIKQLKTI
ncbi:MAG: hypothetical protein ACOC2W_01990 [bacterium]